MRVLQAAQSGRAAAAAAAGGQGFDNAVSGGKVLFGQ